jgi:hypothetical protein
MPNVAFRDPAEKLSSGRAAVAIPDRTALTAAALEWLRELDPLAMLGPDTVTGPVGEEAVRLAEVGYEAALRDIGA